VLAIRVGLGAGPARRGALGGAHLLHLPAGGAAPSPSRPSWVVVLGRDGQHSSGATLGGGADRSRRGPCPPFYFGSGWKDICVYVIFLLVLLLKPSGLLGKSRMWKNASPSARRPCWVLAPGPALHPEPVRAPHPSSSSSLAVDPGREAGNVIGGYAGQYSVGHSGLVRDRSLRAPFILLQSKGNRALEKVSGWRVAHRGPDRAGGGLDHLPAWRRALLRASPAIAGGRESSGCWRYELEGT